MQVLLYALEDFEFADYLHLAIFHTRNRFVESPLGVSPRSWDQQGPAAPVVWTTVHRFLPESYAAARNHVSRRQKHKSRATVSGIVDIEADLGGDVEPATSPEIEKWVQMMQKGGEITLCLEKYLTICSLIHCNAFLRSPGACMPLRHCTCIPIHTTCPANLDASFRLATQKNV